MKINKNWITFVHILWCGIMFLITFTVCAQLLSKSYEMTRDAEDLNRAVAIATDMSEQFKKDGLSNGITYNKNWEKNSDIFFSFSISDSGQLTAIKNGEILFEWKVGSL